MLEYCAPSTNGQARQKKLQKATNTKWFALAAVVNKAHAFLGTGTWPTTFAVNPKSTMLHRNRVASFHALSVSPL